MCSGGRSETLLGVVGARGLSLWQAEVVTSSIVSAERVIAAPAQAIFEILADPALAHLPHRIEVDYSKKS